MSYKWGDNISLEIDGSSHGPYIEVSVTGLPAGVKIDISQLNGFMERRAPGRTGISSGRKEPDIPEFISGISDGILTGETLVIRIMNRDVRRGDYTALKHTPRPGHADYPAYVKSAGKEDLSGGGSYSGRMTAALCAAGGICLQLLKESGIDIAAHILSIGAVRDIPFDSMEAPDKSFAILRGSDFPVLDKAAGAEMRAHIEKLAAEQNSAGGVIECKATGLPAGLGGALTDGIEARLASLVFSVPAVKGFEIGSGFRAAEMTGIENNDAYRFRDGRVTLMSNNCGGLLGGLSAGTPLVFRVAVKPTPSIGMLQQTVDLAAGENTELEIRGRHDPCIVPRAVPVFEAVCALVIYDVMKGSGNGRDIRSED